MKPRLNPYQAAPEAMKTVAALETYVQKCGVEPGLIELIKTWHAAFPDGYMTIEDHWADGDIVVIRNTWHGTHTGDFYGVAPSGKKIEITSIGVDRVRDGKVVEGWGELNMLGAMQQMGAIPSPTGGGA